LLYLLAWISIIVCQRYLTELTLTCNIMSQKTFSGLSIADYAVFGVTLGISAVIGIFFAIRDRKSRDGTEGYMLGGRW